MKKTIILFFVIVCFAGSLTACGLTDTPIHNQLPPEQPVQDESSGQTGTTEPNTPPIHGDTAQSESEGTDSVSALQQLPDLNEEDALILAEKLLSKALYLNFLAHSRVFATDEKVFDINAPDTFVADNGVTYYPVVSLPYATTQEMWDDIYSVFSHSTADAQFAFMFQTLYVDYNGKLHCSGNDGQGKQRDWHIDSLRVKTVSDGMIGFDASVQFMADTFPADLEMVYENGRWVLNDTYYAMPQ